MANKSHLGFIRHELVDTHFKKDVLTVKGTAKVNDAFSTMISKKVAALGVVDDKGKLVANLSLGDLKAISADANRFWRMEETVLNFIKKVKKEFPPHKEGDKVVRGRPRSIVTIKAGDTIDETMKKLLENRIHRVYLVDAEKKPIGVAALRDILDLVLKKACQ